MTPRYRPAGACGVYQDMSGKPFHTEGKAGGEFWGCASNFCMATYKQTMADRLASEPIHVPVAMKNDICQALPRVPVHRATVLRRPLQTQHQ